MFVNKISIPLIIDVSSLSLNKMNLFGYFKMTKLITFKDLGMSYRGCTSISTLGNQSASIVFNQGYLVVIEVFSCTYQLRPFVFY